MTTTMKKTIEINPVSRVEGHGKVTIRLDDNGNVADTQVNITQFRGFEKFCEGRLFWEMPEITPRICGICPVSHQLASAKACDVIMGVELTPTAKLLRELMHMGQVFQSHALHFFHLASPDLIFGPDADPAIRNVIGLIGDKPDVAVKAVKMRSYGQTIIQKLGGKKVHPNGAIAGGMNTALSIADRDELLKPIDELIANVNMGLYIIKNYHYEHKDIMESFAVFPSAYLSLVDENDNLQLYDGKFRMVDADGKVLENQYDPSNYLDLIEEHVEEWSYLKFPVYKKRGYPGGMYRTGPLGRLNACKGIATPLANEELKQFRKLGKNGLVEGTMYFHYARLIELLYSIERIRQILNEKDICSNDILTTSNEYNEQGIGVIEAPRGALFHHYWVEGSGKIKKVNLIVATGNNNLAINKSVNMVAKQYIKNNQITEGILNRVEMAIRCYDPCFSCSTHAIVGEMPLAVQIISADGTLVKELQR